MGVSKSRVYHFAAKTTKRISKNNGYYMFTDKWGMSSKTFTDKYLLRGKLFGGELQNPKIELLTKIKNRIKKITSSFN